MRHAPYVARYNTPAHIPFEVQVMPSLRALRSARLFFAAWLAVLVLGGCAGLLGRDPLRVSVAGIGPLEGRGLEMRFNVKLRVQNPNDTPVDYDGVSLDLALNGKPFASGVSDQRGSVPRFGEAVISVPLTVPAFAAVRQAFAFADNAESGTFPYVLNGKLGGGFAGGLAGATRFTNRGTLTLPGFGTASQ